MLDKHKTDTVYIDDLRIVLPDNARLMIDLMCMAHREIYLSSNTHDPAGSVKRILADMPPTMNATHSSSSWCSTDKAVFFGCKDYLWIRWSEQAQRAFIEHTDLSHPQDAPGQQQETDIAEYLFEGEEGLLVMKRTLSTQ